MRRGKLILGVLVVGALAISSFELHRRATTTDRSPFETPRANEPTATRETMDPDALIEQYSDAAELQRLCEEVTKANIAMETRHRALSHLEQHRGVEYDKQGNEIKEELTWDRVWYLGNREFRQGLKPAPSENGAQRFEPAAPLKQADEVRVCFPFTKEATPGTYRYSLDGHEVIDGKLTLILRFDPYPPLDNRFRGKAWIDPQTFHPVRVEAVAAKNPPFVDKISMAFDYGEAETGSVQAMRSVIGGSGGFAIVHKSYAVFSELSDYRPLDERELAAVNRETLEANARQGNQAP